MMKKLLKIILPCMLAVISVLVSQLTVNAQEKSGNSEGCAISVALDVSGSMKTTDPDRMSIELIKLFIDACGSCDYINITAYNDEIVYSSGMADMGNVSEKESLKQALDTIEFAGNTDNGLGLLTATKAVTEMNGNYSNAFVLMISDGDTYLVNSKTNRTLEDSNNDLKTSANLAIENGITINTIEYTNDFKQDTGVLSVVTSSSGGGITMVDNHTQFIQVILSTFFREYNNGKETWDETQANGVLNRSDFILGIENDTKKTAIIFSTSQIHDFEIVRSSNTIPYVIGKHYVIIDADDLNQDELNTIYSLDGSSVVITGIIETNPVRLTETETEAEAFVPVRKSIDNKPLISAETQADDSQKKYSSLPVIIVILIIILAAAAVCYVIIRKLLFTSHYEITEADVREE